MPRSYAFTAVGTLLLTLAAIAIFSLSINPYKLYPKVSGLSPEISVDVFHYLRLYKPYAIERSRPDHLIVGSSRAARLDPQPLQEGGGTAYNAALPAATLPEIRRAIEHAQAINPLSSVLVGLDYYMFLPPDELAIDPGPDERWKNPDAGIIEAIAHRYQRFEDFWRSLLSVDAMIDSWSALVSTEPSPREYREDGSWNTGAHVDTKYHYAMTLRKHDREFRNEVGPTDFEELQKLLDFTAANNIEVSLLISPMQGLLLHAAHYVGAWNTYLDWQRALVSLANKHSADAKIYGMEDNPALVLESMRAEDPFFVDGVHYKRKVGTQITRCIGRSCDSQLRPTPLDNQSIEAYLEQVEALRGQYERAYPTELRAAHKWLE